MMLVRSCFCGCTGSEASVVNELPVLVCAKCGAMRQDLREFTPESYRDWYREVYHDVVYRHTYDHDRAVAKLRLNSYEVLSGSKLLDVGSGNNAFVDECLARGIDAWGQDLAEQSLGPRIYVGELSTVAFPSESFDFVTMHDVLEHVPDPVAFLKEAARILKPGGTLYVDFPRFHHPAGRQHWKAVEHIWLLDEGHLARLLTASGFDAQVAWNPIESKIVIATKKAPERRITVLVPPGIGDSYWSTTKIPGLLQKVGADRADVYVQDMHPRRTGPYLRNVSSVVMQDYRELPLGHPVLNEAYRQNGRTVFPGEFGMDYFVAYNGALEHGRSLDEADPELGVDWRPRTHSSKEAIRARDDMRAGGPYAACYWVDHGMYKRWLREFPGSEIDRVMTGLVRRGLRVVVVGAEWDKPLIGNRLAKGHGRVNMVGATSFDQLYGIIAGAQCVVGFPSGATMLGPLLNVPTILIWNRQKFPDTRFWTNCVPPDAPYRALDTRKLRSDKVLSCVDQIRAERAGA